MNLGPLAHEPRALRADGRRAAKSFSATGFDVYARENDVSEFWLCARGHVR
jgi:hypothetical protein